MVAFTKDRNVIRRLVSEYAEAAGSERNRKAVQDWKALNSLNPARPMMTIDQIPWHEMNIDGELDLFCEDVSLRELEQTMRRALYKWRHMDTDQTLPEYVEVPKVIHNTGFGIEITENTLSIDNDNEILSHEYIDQLQTEEDLSKLRIPAITYDAEETDYKVALLEKAAGDLFPIRAVGILPYFNAWDKIAMLRSVTSIYMDFIDRPEFLHAIMSRFLEIELSSLRQMEEQNLLNPYAQLVHCSGTHTDELPAEGFDSGHVRSSDCWGFGMAQIFSSCSAEMHEEFEVKYAAEYYKHIGLVYYGCCEPLHNKIHLVRQLPHVRKISISPWADVNIAAENIGKDYVLSKKINPAFLAADNADEAALRAEIRETLNACARNGAPCEFILKDISTVRYKPQNLFRWSVLFREELSKFS